MYANYLVLFAILFTGYFLRKIRFLDDAMNHGLNKFIVYFAYPCMIVHNLGTLETVSYTHLDVYKRQVSVLSEKISF